MKRILMTGVGLLALACAVQPAAAQRAAPAPIFNWSGFYVGAQAGYGWGKSEHFDLAFSYGDVSIDGGAFGATTGFNWQVSPSWLFGVETDFSWSNIKGENDLGLCNCVTEIDWFGTARVRTGWVNGPSLLYVAGGLAYGKMFLYSNLPDQGTVKRTGWTLGAGWEQAFAPNWSAKIEYLYVDFGKSTYDNTPAGDNYSADTQFHLVRVGVNYRFATGKGPVTASY